MKQAAPETPATEPLPETSAEAKLAANPAAGTPTHSHQVADAGISVNSVGTEVVRLLVSVAFITIAVLLLKHFFKPPAAPPKKEDNSNLAAKVKTVPIVTHEGGLDIEVDGMTVPFREIRIAAEVAGRVEFKSDACRAGNFVKAKTPLLRIDKATYELEVKRLEQQKQEASQNITELEVEIKNANELIALAGKDLTLRGSELQRQRDLSNKGVGTATAVENAQRMELGSKNTKTTYENQKRLLESRKARLATTVELAEIRLRQARLDLARCEIVAPADGVIVSEMVEADSYVQRGANLLMFEDTKKVEVRCSLTMDELYRLWQASGQERATGDPYNIPNMPVTVTYDLAGRTFAWAGQLTRYDGVGLDEKTRTVPCRVVVKNPRDVKEMVSEGSLVDAKDGPPALVRGMFVKSKIHTSPAVKFLRVPQRAVQPGNKIWLVRDGKLVIQDAIIAGITGDDLLIDGEASEIKSDEYAIISPMVEVYDGMAVQEVTK